MKKVVFILFYLVILLSCESNRRTCWTCTTKFSYVFTGQNTESPIITTIKTDKCDMSKKEIKEFEKRLTTTQTFRESLVSTITITECIEKISK